MTPRVRTIHDDAILAAAARTIGRRGPTRLTLADIGKESGLSPATLLQRFGSKRGLMLALVQRGAEATESDLAETRNTHPKPLDALMAVALSMTRMAESPATLSNHLASIQIGLTDREFHELALAQSRALRKVLRSLLADAVEQGELVPCNTRALGRLLQTVLNGSLVTWAVHRKGSAATAVRRDVTQLLLPWRVETPSIVAR